MRKKIICSLLIVAMLITSMDVTAWAGGAQTMVQSTVTEQPEHADITGGDPMQERESQNLEDADSAPEGGNANSEDKDSAQEGENMDSADKDSEQDSGNTGSEDKDSTQDGGNTDSGDKNPEDEDSTQKGENPDSADKDSDEDGDNPEEDKNPEEEDENTDSEENPDTENGDSEGEEGKDSDAEGPKKEIESITEEGLLFSCGLANYEAAAEFARGSGTEQDPYEIRTIEELNLFSQEASKSGRYYKLMQNIRLNDSLDSPANAWTPIGEFKGHLDGNGHKIENLYICLEAVDVNLYRQDIGLFSYATSSASIQNLTVENALIELNVQSATGSPMLDMGVIVGESYAPIENCTVSGSVAMKNLNPIQGMSVKSIGGIVGSNGGTLLNCDMKATLDCPGQMNTSYANTGVGGMAGVNRGTVNGCANYGQITMEEGGAAGIAYSVYDNSGVIQTCRNEAGASVTALNGDAAGIVAQGRGSIQYCRNIGDVTGTEEKIVAGIASNFSQGLMAECINEGTLSGSGKLAGIVGYLSQGSADIVSVRKCENKADISQELTTWNGYCSGVVGDIVDNANGTGAVVIADCSNTGSISGDEVGGIIESIECKKAQMQVSGCHNEGTLNGVQSAAGIVRDINFSSEHVGSVTVTDCYNQGEIIVSEGTNYAGGIAGSLSHAVIRQCYNAGKITSAGMAGGIVGKLGFWGGVDDTVVEACFNLGEIASARSAAGISAEMSGGTISRCYNMGRIVASAAASENQSIGGILGESSLMKVSGDGAAVVENCFNCGVIAAENGKSNNVGGIAGEIFSSGEGASMTLRHCYHIGTFETGEQKKGYYGAVIGYASEYQQGSIQAEKLYYLEDGVPAVGYANQYELPDTKACTLDQLSQVSTYEGWDFTEIWKKGNRKYQFPILQGVGENYLVYNYGGIGQDTVFGEYIIQAVDQDSEAGISGAVFSFQDQIRAADRNGMIRILAADPALGTVLATRNNYHDKSEEVTLKYGEINTLRMERKKEVKMPRMSMSANPNIEAGETTIEGDTAPAVKPEKFPIKIDLKFSTLEESDKGEEGGGFKDSLPVKAAWETGENGEKKSRVKITIGSETKETYYDDYDHVKSKLDEWKSKQSKEVLKELGNMDARKINGKFGAESLKIYLMGYITIDFSGGSPKLIESGAVLGMEGEGSLTCRPVWAGTVAYGQFTLNVRGEGKVNVSYDEMLGYFNFDTSVTAGMDATFCVGIGYDFAKGEVGATGTLETDINIKKNWDVNKDLEIQASLVPYALVKIGFFNIKTGYKGWNDTIWPMEQVQSMLMEEVDGASYYISDRDYLTGAAQGELSILSADQEMRAAGGLDMDSVYPEGEPQIGVMSDGTRVAVWIADDGSKASADRTTLYYAVIKEDAVVHSGAVCETGRGDFSPRLLVKGDSVYVAWLNADKQYGDSTTMEEFCGNMSLYLAVFNGTGFEEPLKVTEEGNHLPMLASLCSDGTGVTVTWVENSVDNAFLAAGTNSIYSRQYASGQLAEKKLLAEQLPYLYGLDSGYVNGSYSAVWSQDTDGDPATGEDAEVYLYQDGTVRQFTDNAIEDTDVQFLGDELYWCSGKTIRRSVNLATGSSESLGILCGSAFQLIQGTAGKAAVWMENDGFATVPVISYEKGGAFTNPVPLGGFDHVNISGYSALYEEDGTVSMLYDEKKVYEEWTDTPYGQTNMRYTRGLTAADLVVDEYLYYDTTLTAPGAVLSFRTDVTNHTAGQIDTLHLVLRSGEQVLKEEDKPIELAVGCTEAVELEYTLPQDFAVGSYTLTVTAAEAGEENLSNNQASAQVGYGNVKLQDCGIARGEDGTAVISGTMVNDGYQTVSGKTLYVRAGGQEGEVIAQTDGVSLAVGESMPFTFTIGKEYTEFTGAYDVDYFYLALEGEMQEINHADNTELLMLRPVAAERVALEADFQMSTGTSRTLQASVTPQDAYAGCIYTSSDLSVASVSPEGMIMAYGAGQTDISVMTKDGQAAASCTVTVVENSEAVSGTAYSISDTKVSLTAGEEAVLYVYAETEEGVTAESVSLTWHSSDESVASVAEESVVLEGTAGGENADSVDNTDVSDDTAASENAAAAGRVKALKEGSTVVTATSESGVALYCIVTVRENGIKAVTLEKTVYEMQKGEAQQLSWVSSPEGAAASDFTFTCSDESIATVSPEGQISALAQGSARIEMVYNGARAGQAVKAACMVEVTDPALTVYSVIFDTNGGGGLADYLAFQTGGPGHVFVFPETPSRPGYNFEGWNDKQDGTGNYYGTDSALTAGGNVTEDLILYAVWVSPREGLWAADVPDQVYTGSKLFPKVTVYDGTRKLEEGTDYTLSYKNNVKVAAYYDGSKAPAVIVKGKGNYAGSQTVNFNILPRDIGSSEGIEAADLLLKANRKTQKAVPVVTWNGKKLANKKDFTLEYPELMGNAEAYKAAGIYRILIKGVGGYTGEREVTLTITDNDLISKASVKGVRSQAYTGEAIKQEFTVKYGKRQLVEDVDYTVSYENNTEIGTATILLTGIGSYSGVKKVTFKITGGNIKKAKATGIPKSMVYTGGELTAESSSWGQVPKLMMTVNKEDKILTEGIDYTISYQKNTNAGTASVIFTGINGYSGSLKKSFKILPCSLETDTDGSITAEVNDSGRIPYSKGGSKPKPVVTHAGRLLTEGKDYTLSYKNHTKLSEDLAQGKEPLVIIKGKGNFKGSITLSFTIVRQDLETVSMTAPDKAYQNKKNAYKSVPKLIDINGGTLKAGTDYEKNYIYRYQEETELADGSIRYAGEEVGADDILPAGTRVEIEVTGKGNYSGQLKGRYRVVQSDISKAKVTVDAQDYTGGEIKPDKYDITVKLGKTILQDDDYEITGYGNNVKKGKASVTIKGVGNYGGTKTVKFTIRARSILAWWQW